LHTYLDQDKQNLLKQELQKDKTVTQSGNDCYKLGIIAGNKNAWISAFCCNSRLNLYAARHQTGSTAKPVTVYAPAFGPKAISVASPVLDEITDFNGYRPQNSNGNCSGWTTVREVLKGSRTFPQSRF